MSAGAAKRRSPQLLGDAREDAVVPEALGLQLAVPARDELLDRLGEVREELVQQASRGPGPEGGGADEVADEVFVAGHGGPR